MKEFDLINLQPSVISRDLRQKYILLTGQNKIGKTEFLSQIPNCLILAFEKGTNGRPGSYVVPIETWSEFKQVLRELEKEEVQKKFGCIGIDTIGIAFELCTAFICNREGVEEIKEIPYGQGWGMRDREFEEALRRITMLNYGLAATCHLKTSYDDDGKLLLAMPDLPNRCMNIINSLVDISGVILQTWNAEGKSERWLVTRSTPTIQAGSRYKYLEPKIPFGYEHLIEALGKAIDEEEKRGATVVNETSVEVKEPLNYATLYLEAQNFWFDYIADREDSNKVNIERANEVLKIIERTFGKKVKLSEITEDQVEQLAIIVKDLRKLKEKYTSKD